MPRTIHKSIRYGVFGQGASVWQVDEQPSPSTVFPSSQVSPLSTMPLPQHGGGGGGGGSSVWQVDEQPSPSIVLPSSHCSPLSTWPSPQHGAGGGGGATSGARTLK